jgi:hypothetical protein
MTGTDVIKVANILHSTVFYQRHRTLVAHGKPEAPEALPMSFFSKVFLSASDSATAAVLGNLFCPRFFFEVLML